MDIPNSTKGMERTELPKLKKAFVSLQKLDMITQMPASEDRNEKNKGTANMLEENEDPSSENVSTGSAESNVICTDDDDLEKKIQAFSIPVKKDNENTETESVKSHSDKSVVIEKGSEGIKAGKKQTSKLDGKTKEKSALKRDRKTSTESKSIVTQKTDIVSKGLRKKKESAVNNKIKTDNEKKSQSAGNVHVADKEQENNTYSAKPYDVNISLNKVPSDHKLRNGKSDKPIEKSIDRKNRKSEHEAMLESAVESEVSRKRKALKDENTNIKAKKLVEKKKLKILNEPTSSTSNKEKKKKGMDVKLRSDLMKRKKIIPSKDPPKLSDQSPLHVKRSARISGVDSRSKYDIKKNTEKKILRSKSQRKSIELYLDKVQKSEIEMRKRHSERDRSSITSKLKVNGAGKTNEKKKEKVSDKSISTRVGKKIIRNSMPKDDSKVVEKVTGVKKDHKEAYIATQEDNSISKEISQTKSDGVDKPLQKSGPDDDDDDEELFEKIYDILEAASGVPDSGCEEKQEVTQKLYIGNEDIIFPSNEGLLIPDPSFFKPRILHKNSKFPSQGKGTVSYKKLWKWSHYVKMPSDMWSIHKHPDGNFVVVFHVSEMSPFPKLVIDKCIIFKETASPCVKIYGKDVLALSSENELQTLGNVCSFLKQIHNISLCEGMLSLGDKNNNCELYTDGKVSLPYKCKSCL